MGDEVAERVFRARNSARSVSSRVDSSLDLDVLQPQLDEFVGFFFTLNASHSVNLEGGGDDRVDFSRDLDETLTFTHLHLEYYSVFVQYRESLPTSIGVVEGESGGGEFHLKRNNSNGGWSVEVVLEDFNGFVTSLAKVREPSFGFRLFVVCTLAFLLLNEPIRETIYAESGHYSSPPLNHGVVVLELSSSSVARESLGEYSFCATSFEIGSRYAVSPRNSPFCSPT